MKEFGSEKIIFDKMTQGSQSPDFGAEIQPHSQC